MIHKILGSISWEMGRGNGGALLLFILPNPTAPFSSYLLFKYVFKWLNWSQMDLRSNSGFKFAVGLGNLLHFSEVQFSIKWV